MSLEQKVQAAILADTPAEELRPHNPNMDAMSAVSGTTDDNNSDDEGELNRLQNYTTWSEQIAQDVEAVPVEQEGGAVFQFATQDSPRRVYLAIKVKRISDVDNIRETFRCRFHVYFNWLLTFGEYMEYLRAKEQHSLAKWVPRFKPRYEFVNIVEAHEIEEVTYPTGPFRIQSPRDFAPEHLIGFKSETSKMVRLKVDFDITFCEELELRNFPFDCQDYSIVLRESSGINKASFVPEMRTLKEDRNGRERKKPSHFARVDPSFSVLDEWEFHNTRVEFAYSSATKSRGQTAYHQVTIRFKMRRKYLVYFWNVALYMLVISLLSLTAFFIDRASGGERLTLVITLLLTAVANQHVVFELLPNVPYLTILHKYILTCFIFIALVTIQSALVQVDILPWFSQNARRFDAVSLSVYSGFWLFYNVAFVIWCAWKRHWESQKLYLDSDEIEDYVDSYDKHNFTLTWTPNEMQWKGTQGRIATFVDTDPRYEEADVYESFCLFFMAFLGKMCMCRCCPRDECCGYFPANYCNSTPESCCGCCCRSETPRERLNRQKREKSHRSANFSSMDPNDFANSTRQI